MSSFELTIGLNTSRASFLERLYREISAVDAEQIGLSSLNSKLGMLESYWLKFEATHEQLIDSCYDIDDAKAIPYFKKGIYNSALEHYHEARTLLQAMKDRKRVSYSPRRSPGRCDDSSSSSKTCLPAISLPNFSGVYSEWRQFRYLFSSLVGSNPDLSNVEKMQYLRSTLTGEPADLISKLTTSEESFSRAWHLLLSHYENKRLLISNQLELLLNPVPMAAHSAEELNSLLTRITDAVTALDTLGSPSEHWDQIVVYTIVQSLSSNLREAWEVHIDSSTEYPTFLDLKDFLIAHVRAMKKIEVISPSRLSTVSSEEVPMPERRSIAKPARVKITMTPPRDAEATKSRTSKCNYPCSMCGGEHYISSCSAFKKLTLEDRREVVVTLQRLCFNCLGLHSLRNCRTTTNCQICDGVHHSLLCDESPEPVEQQRPARRHRSPVSTSLREQVRNNSKAVKISSHPYKRRESSHFRRAHDFF